MKVLQYLRFVKIFDAWNFADMDQVSDLVKVKPKRNYLSAMKKNNYIQSKEKARKTNELKRPTTI